MYRVPKFTGSSLAESKDEEDAFRKKDVEDLISKYARKNVEKQLDKVISMTARIRQITT